MEYTQVLGLSPPSLRSFPGTVNLGFLWVIRKRPSAPHPHPQVMFLAFVGHLFPVGREKLG